MTNELGSTPCHRRAGEACPGQSLRARRVWLAPVCLLLVAALHAWRVATTEQTPWKGGSFGMFSTIDGESSRFVRCWLITEQGEVPVEIPAELNKKVAELRAAPSLAGVKSLSLRLSQRSWIDPQLARRQLALEWTRLPGDQPLTAERLNELRGARITPASLGPTTSHRDTALVAASPNSSSAAIPFRKLRVELWKYELPAGTTELRSRLLLASEQTPPETRP